MGDRIMIKFRQKEYVLPAALLTVGRGALGTLNAAGNVAAIGGIVQGAQQMKQSEQQAEEQAAQNRKITKALNNIAENAKNNPQASQQAADVMSQKQFAKINLGGMKKIWGTIKNNPTFKNASGLAKDVGTIVKENRGTLISGTLAGGVLAGSSYITDKAIQHDMKKNGIPVQKNYAVTGSILKGLKTAGKETWKAAKDHKGMIVSMAALGAAPVGLGYMAEKQQLKDQVANTQQKTYSLKLKSFGKFGWIKNTGKFFKNPIKNTKEWWNKQPLKNTTGETILGFMSNMSGGGGREGVSKFGQRLQELGKKSGSTWSQKTGKFIVDHPKTALAASVPVGIGTMALTWDAGEKLVRKGIKAADKNAYAYQESKEEQIQ